MLLIEPYWNLNKEPASMLIELFLTFNRTILEFKFPKSHLETSLRFQLLIEPYWNLNHRSLIVHENNETFNRTILEFKFVQMAKDNGWSPQLLIEPYWNLNPNERLL